MILAQAGLVIRTAAAVCTLLVSGPNEQPSSATFVETVSAPHTLTICNPQSNCVSSNYREPPNRYVSPFRIVNEPDVAFQRAVRDLRNIDGSSEISIVEISPKDYYIHATVPGTAPSSLDEIEIFFSENIVNVKCEARVTLPPPPFCVKKNCINGNMDQRSRVERLGRILGLPANDVDEMRGAKWTPIFLNSDRVPGFDDDDDYERD